MSSKPINVLLADDDADDRYLFDKALKELSFTTQLTIINDGELLMNYLSDNSNPLPDVLFLDLSMPRKTGFECLTEIKENIRLKDITVIVFTTSFRPGIELEQKLENILTSMGAEEYVRKPSGFDNLKQVIEEILVRVIAKGNTKSKKEAA